LSECEIPTAKQFKWDKVLSLSAVGSWQLAVGKKMLTFFWDTTYIAIIICFHESFGKNSQLE